MKKLIGLDIGTLSTKGVLVDQDGTLLAREVVPHNVEYPRPGWVEQDAENIWWAETIRVLRGLLAQVPDEINEIAGIGISGLFPALVIADEDGRVIRPALLYSDNRASRELELLNEHFHLALNGDAITPKLAWLKANEPENFRRIHFIFSTHNYIVYRLTGTYCIDYKVASSLGGLFDPDRLEWREDLLTWIGLDRSHLPRLCSPIDIVGQITQEASSVTGLPVGMPVISGSGDSLFTLIGAGVINQGEALLSLGTTGWLGVLPHDLEAYFHNPMLARQGAPYLLCAYLLSLGSALCWIRDKFAFSEKLAAEQQRISMFQLLDEAASNIPAASEGVCVLPYFQGKRQINVREPVTGAICGLRLSHNPIHIYRGLLESYGYVVRSAIEKLSTDGIPLKRFVFTGSGSGSVLWRQIISDITGKPWQHYANLEPCLGNAFLVGYALGNYSSLAKIRDWLPEPSIHSPNGKVRQLYDDAYERFVLLRSALSV